MLVLGGRDIRTGSDGWRDTVMRSASKAAIHATRRISHGVTGARALAARLVTLAIRSDEGVSESCRAATGPCLLEVDGVIFERVQVTSGPKSVSRNLRNVTANGDRGEHPGYAQGYIDCLEIHEPCRNELEGRCCIMRVRNLEDDCGHAASQQLLDGADDQSARCACAVCASSLDLVCGAYKPTASWRFRQDGVPDMFCNLTVEEFSAYSDSAASDEYRENPRLSLLARDRRNLVLDSACPELAPHIVVTPPEGDPWADYWASWSNRVDPQDDSLLTVPVRDHSFGFLPPTLDYDLAIEEIPEGSTPDPMLCPHHLHSEPRRVFSHSRFTQKIHLETQERQAIWLTRILDALRRRQYRTTIILASLEAPSFRCRWGDPDFRVAVERPFKWSDPAEPLLSEYGRYLGSTVIDSHKPCSIPHIVIQEPPPQIPWTLDTGCTPSPQDFGFGYYLTVPSPAVEYINCEAMPDEERYTEDSAGERTPSSSSDMTEVSSLETLVLDEDYGAPSCAVASDPFALDSDDDITPLPSLGPDAKGLLCEKFRSLCLGTFEASWANEDDDLPPFDTWYQGTASRAH